MSNLGWYQTIVTAAKAVRGPKKLLGLILAGGAALGVAGTLATQKAMKGVNNKKNKKNKKCLENKKSYVFHTEGMDNNGLLFKAGDTYRILNHDGDSIFIVKSGDDDNPYVVSAQFLETVSDFLPEE